ncbi:unnamed protein product [Medioppia subpectinata]|uniref:Aquaporin n=1 Tax=Medioppia subpectinata TaxID=1979941 RepID=A0A7R9KWB0_9ACAR|nr:unnamed protein product [Medioppia subpectinata]CAG2111048.1 unnamed protein product [Medioppia subpectinata]
MAAGDVVYQLKIGNIEILMIAMAFGSGIAAAFMIVGHISGAVFNPAVCVALATMNRFPPKKLIHYILGQYLGAFCASATLHLYFWPHMKTDTGVDQTKQLLNALFVTTPHININFLTACFDGFLSCFILMIIIMAISDQKTNAIPHMIEPIYIVICFFLGLSGVLLLELFPSKAINLYDNCVGNQTCVSGSGMAAGDAVYQLKIGNTEILVIALAFGSGVTAAFMIVGHISGNK